MPTASAPPITIRPARREDAPACGAICYQAFRDINTRHSFPPDFPNAETTTGLLANLFSHPNFYCVVAEVDGTIVGSNCLDERDAIAGVGPITVDPRGQNKGVGRALMEAVLLRGRDRRAPGVRLVQAAFHNRSLALYTDLGFDVREPLACMSGEPLGIAVPGCAVRPATIEDLDDMSRVCRQVHGFDRAREVAEAIRAGSARVVEQGGRITGYSTAIAFFGHAVGQSPLDLQALIGAAESFGGPGMLVPTRESELFRWCLRHGLRVVQPMTLMSLGLYNEPKGSWLPSISL